MISFPSIVMVDNSIRAADSSNETGRGAEVSNAFTAVVAMRLRRLTDEELAEFNLATGWNDGNMKEHCNGRPWFNKVKDFFTENDGNNIHSDTITAISRVALQRLTESVE